MNLRVAGTLAPFVLFLVGCGATETNPLPSKTLRVELSNVAWAAYQDGDGLWQRLPEGTAVPAMRTLSFDVGQLARSRLLPRSKTRRMPQPESVKRRLEPLQAEEVLLNITDAQGRYGLAYVCSDDDPSYAYSDLGIELSTLEIGAERTLRCYTGGEEPSYTLSGTVTGLGEANQGAVYTFINDPIFIDGLNTAYSFELEQGVYDVIATRYGGNATAPDKVVIQNDVTVETNQTLDLDFESDAAFTPELYTATITDVTEGLTPSGSVTIASKNFTYAALGGVASKTTFDYAFIPAGEAGSEALVYAYAEGSNDSGTEVSMNRFLDDPADITLSLPEPLSGARVGVQGSAPYRFPVAAWNAYPGEEAAYALFYDQFSPEGSSSFAFVYIDQGWLGNAATYSYALPDLSAVSGWNNAWNLRTDEEVGWTIGAYVERNPGAESPDYVSVQQSGTVP